MEEILFQGTNELTLDDKGRLTVPTRYRDSLREISSGELTVTRLKSNFLVLFPRPVWKLYLDHLNHAEREFDAWRRLTIGSAYDVALDGASRVLIAPELRRAAGLTNPGPAVLIGVGKHLELWETGRLDAANAATDLLPLPPKIAQFVG